MSLGSVIGAVGAAAKKDPLSAIQVGINAAGAFGQNAQAQGNLRQQQATMAANQLQNARQGLSNAYQNQARMGQDFFQNQQADTRTRAAQVAGLRPIGETQKYAANNALKLGLLNGAAGGALNGITPGDPAIAKAMGSNGYAKVSNFLTPQLMSQMNQMLGPQATMQAIKTRDADITQLNPYAQTSNYTSLYGAAGMPTQIQAALLGDDALNRYTENESRAQALLQTAINNDVQNMQDNLKQAQADYQRQQQKQQEGNGFINFLKKAAPFAAMAIPFIGPVAGALGMGATAASGVANGVRAAQAAGNLLSTT